MSLDLQTSSKEEIFNAFLLKEKEVETLQQKNISLQQQLDWFRKQVYGQKTERLIPQDPKQTTIFDVPETPPAESVTVKEYERNTRKNPTDASDNDKVPRFDDSIPVDEEIVYPAQVKGLTEGTEFVVIGQKETVKLVQIPTQYRIKKTIRKTVKLLKEETIHTAPAPSSAIEGSFADETFLAGLITEKFLYHMPLCRQHQKLERMGVHVSRIHLTRLVHRSLELLEPIYYSILSSVISSEMIAMDETPIKAGKGKKKGTMNNAYFWPVFGGGNIAFYYSSSRSKKVIVEILEPPDAKNKDGKQYKILLSDGYAAYDAYAKSRENVTHACCWAHVRRKFFDARSYSAEQCEHAIGIIRKLFQIEEEISDFDVFEKLQARQERCSPLIDQFFEWVNEQYYQNMVLKDSPLGKALTYSLKLEQELTQFLIYADLPISNNAVERSIRPVAVGRKNWLFCMTEVGAKYTAIAYTLIECCKLHGIDPWHYFVDVLRRIDRHSARDVHLLQPLHWKETVAKDTVL
jgi:transposase